MSATKTIADLREELKRVSDANHRARTQLDDADLRLKRLSAEIRTLKAKNKGLRDLMIEAGWTPAQIKEWTHD